MTTESDKQYPSRVVFLLADDIREEKQGNKVTLLGLYAGDEILFPGMKAPVKGSSPIVIPGIALLAILKGGRGKFQMTAELFDPSEAPVVEPIKTEVEKMPGDSLSLNFKWAPFPFSAFGRYRFRLTLDDHPPYEYRFHAGATASGEG